MSREQAEITSFVAAAERLGKADRLKSRDTHYLHQEKETRKVAYHERKGHERVARAKNWRVHKVSVLAEGAVLGYVMTSPNPTDPLHKQWRDFIVICLAGWAAEVNSGIDDHRGCGSDFAQADYAADVLRMMDPYAGSKSKILNDARSEALYLTNDNSDQMESDVLDLTFNKAA